MSDAKAKPLDVLELFQRYGATIRRRCVHLLGDDAQGDDATQEVFLRVLRSGAAFEGRSSPLTWLWAIATTHCLQVLRNKRRREGKHDLLSACGEATVTPRYDDHLLLTKILDEMDPQTQQLAVLRHVDGWSLEEISASVGLSRKTVAKKLAGFVVTAREILDPQDALAGDNR